MTLDFDPTIDLYKALGVEPRASNEDVKRAYRGLAKQFHPDITGGDKRKETRFKEISAAYEYSGDPAKRARYDEAREQLRSGRAYGGGRGAGPADIPFDMTSLLEELLSAKRSAGFQADFGDAWPFGGAAGGGRAQARARRRAARVAEEPPAPVRRQASDGSWLTMTGADVASDLRLPFGDAILGTVRSVGTVDGVVTVKIPPGTSSGQKLRLRGKGVPGGDGAPGDHYVTVHIDVPKNLDDEAKRRLAELISHLDRGKQR